MRFGSLFSGVGGFDLSLTYLYENAKDRIKAEMLPLLTLIEQD